MAYQRPLWESTNSYEMIRVMDTYYGVLHIYVRLSGVARPRGLCCVMFERVMIWMLGW